MSGIGSCWGGGGNVSFADAVFFKNVKLCGGRAELFFRFDDCHN